VTLSQVLHGKVKMAGESKFLELEWSGTYKGEPKKGLAALTATANKRARTEEWKKKHDLAQKGPPLRPASLGYPQGGGVAQGGAYAQKRPFGNGPGNGPTQGLSKKVRDSDRRIS
jgi:hypothetical protein